MAMLMNVYGPKWTRDHLEAIINVMEAEAKTRGLPFTRAAASALVRLACRRAERG